MAVEILPGDYFWQPAKKLSRGVLTGDSFRFTIWGSQRGNGFHTVKHIVRAKIAEEGGDNASFLPADLVSVGNLLAGIFPAGRQYVAG